MDVETRPRALLCVGSIDLDYELRVALDAAGCSVRGIGELDAVLDVVEPGGDAVVVTDDSDPNWLDAVAVAVRERPRVRCVAITDLREPDEFLAAIGAGIAGFCSRRGGVAEIVRAVRSLLDDHRPVPRPAVELLAEERAHGRRCVQAAGGDVTVSEREWSVLQLLMFDNEPGEIAVRLQMSASTVRSHVAALVRKFGAVDRDDVRRLVGRGAADTV